MSEYLYRVFQENEGDLVRDVIHQLRHSTSPHYMGLENDVLQQRVETLVAYFLQSLHEPPHQFVKYVSEMASERIAEGFSVSECLMSLRILEEESWLLISQFIPQQGLVKALSRVTGTIGTAKDEIANIFVESLKDNEQIERVG